MDAESQLFTLLDDPAPGVRLWAAAHSLALAPDRAAPVLQALAAGPPSPVRLVAEIALRQWRENRRAE